MRCVVLRPFGGDGRILSAGEVIDADAWGERRTRQLIDQRYLKAEPDKPQPKRAKEA